MNITDIIETILNPILCSNHGVAPLKKLLSEIEKTDKYMSEEFLTCLVESMGYFISSGIVVSTN